MKTIIIVNPGQIDLQYRILCLSDVDNCVLSVYQNLFTHLTFNVYQKRLRYGLSSSFPLLLKKIKFIKLTLRKLLKSYKIVLAWEHLWNDHGKMSLLEYLLYKDEKVLRYLQVHVCFKPEVNL